jgi:hypothetical protein
MQKKSFSLQPKTQMVKTILYALHWVSTPVNTYKYKLKADYISVLRVSDSDLRFLIQECLHKIKSANKHFTYTSQTNLRKAVGV